MNFPPAATYQKTEVVWFFRYAPDVYETYGPGTAYQLNETKVCNLLTNVSRIVSTATRLKPLNPVYKLIPIFPPIHAYTPPPPTGQFLSDFPGKSAMNKLISDLSHTCYSPANFILWAEHKTKSQGHYTITLHIMHLYPSSCFFFLKGKAFLQQDLTRLGGGGGTGQN